MHPSEYGVCRRCGGQRTNNLGKKRQAKSTGLCRDCFGTVYPGGVNVATRKPPEPVICCVCEKEFRAFTSHMKVHRGRGEA